MQYAVGRPEQNCHMQAQDMYVISDYSRIKVLTYEQCRNSVVSRQIDIPWDQQDRWLYTLVAESTMVEHA